LSVKKVSVRLTIGVEVLAVALAGALVACGEPVEQAPAAGNQTLDRAAFETDVNPLYDDPALNCSSSGCHNVNGGSGGSFKIYANAAPGSPEMDANFFATVAFINLSNPPQSKLLLEPLAGAPASVGGHGGGDIFADTADPDYQTLCNWIRNGSTAPSPPAC
jgi:hypothetical protein